MGLKQTNNIIHNLKGEIISILIIIFIIGPSNLLSQVNLLNPSVFAGLLFGAMLPYVFSALCMKSVGKAAQDQSDLLYLRLEY